MAVALDAVGTGHQTVAGTSISDISLTIGTGTNRALIVLIGGDNTISGLTATWDNGGTNQALSQIVTQSSVGGAQVWIFGLVNPTSGNKTLLISWTGTKEIDAVAVSFTGVDQTGGATSFPNSASATGNSTSPSVTITSSASDMAVGILGSNNLGNITSPSQTEILNFNSGCAGIFDIEGQRVTTPSASITFSGTQATGQWTAAGCDIKAAGAGFTPKFRRTLSQFGTGIGKRQPHAWN